MTAKSLLAPHWMREHPDRQDLPHIEAMQYKSVKLFLPAWSDAGFSRDLLTVLPKDSYILARDHALSEQKEDMWRDPVAAGNNHAQQWINKVHSGEYHLPTDRSFFLGINEPDATNGDRSKIDLYNESFLDRLAVNGLRGGAFNFSTGHPRTVDGTPNTPADYSVFERSHQAIVRGNHIGVLHIYGTGAVPCAPGHYDRLKACTWQDVEWVVGEFGVDEYVIGGQEHVGYQKYFNGRLNDYCQWLDTAIMGINDPRIHSFQMFTYDFAHPWSSFDVHPIRAALESYQWQHMAHIDSQPSTIHVPAISTGPAEPTPSAPQGDNWARIYAFIRKWEGGWADNPADPGGATNKGITYGTFVSWRTAHGQPTPTRDDLRNISDAETERIYHDWYYVASGSDKLPWPLSLAQTDTAVNAGVGRAQAMLAQSGGDFLSYMGHLIQWYASIPNFETFGRGWMNRRGDLLVEASKP